MTPNATPYGGDSDSLQADVMRFMAIIAFCLIAILALVKNVEPPVENKTAHEPTPTEKVKSMEPTQAVAKTTDLQTWERPLPPLPAESVTLEPTPRPTPGSAPRSTPRSGPEPTSRPRPEPLEIPSSKDIAAVEPEISVAPAVPPEATPVQASPETASPEKEEGLSLRFASDGDFLRLIARGDIRVYAFKNTDVLTLDASYNFLDSASPGQVYELLPETIPALIVTALDRARADSGTFTWAIALPMDIQKQINAHMESVSSGQLVIDRYSEVHHVPLA